MTNHNKVVRITSSPAAPERDGTHSAWETAPQLLEASALTLWQTDYKFKELSNTFHTIGALYVLFNAIEKILFFDHNLAIA